MSKEAERVESGYIEFEVQKADVKKVLSAHKRFAVSGKNVENSVLAWIKFSVSNEELTLITTDGSRALISKLSVMQPAGTDGEFLLSMASVSKLSFMKGEFDMMLVHCEKGKVEFIDPEFKTTQTFITKKEDGNKYLSVEKFIPKKTDFTITVSQKFIKDIAALKAPKGYVELSFNSKDVMQAILVETASDEVSQTAILMPIRKEPIEE